MPDVQVSVLVVGGSLTGLTASVHLATQGVSHLLVERHRGTAVHPRAASFHQRTMEIFRGVGLQDAVEAAAEKEFVQDGAIVSVSTLSNPEMQYFYRSFNEGVEELSPTRRLFITQIGLEPVLRERARALGAEHRYATELVGFEQDDDGVTSVIRSRDDGQESTVRSDYLVAADGAHSAIRARSGIDMVGRPPFAQCITIYFQADMRELLGDRNLSVVYVNQPGLLGFFRFSITGDSGFLAVFSSSNPDGTRDTHVAEDLDEARCVQFVHQALGRTDISVRIDDVQRWTAEAAHAASFQDRRVFLIGDAAHVMPPTGGFGGNTGVADAHGLAWRLALVSRGIAGAGLLASYDQERRPVSDLTVEQAYTRYALRVDPSLPRDDLAAPLDDPSIELGTIYRSAAVMTGEGEDDESLLVDPREPSGRPGTRAPHIPVEADGRPASVLDLFGAGFVLLAGTDGQVWCDVVAELAASTDLPLRAYRVGAGGVVQDPEGRFPAAFGIGPTGATLIRPDGVVAWRSADAGAEPRGTVADVMTQLLAR
ncbi:MULTISPECIES: FAD-dependent monooxygenase [unclassified Modestobacter]|uniref:FAD-dependent monooxygenase n=1 Tax=unclassified Modestobacter TaxID=2643866 RepID=UPI0022AA76AE|nr:MULTISPECIES: FAD-dependent monooxygenase [unclassified Modestobacter]MCZ2823166.1 FAD-dependent monooxygenase [Modestobacter sp. VKM Ac-2981]MCZ2851412.1 FAD-dependent monooxygenase [Modestobacter sp. VKM Ac-2982]